MNNVSLRTIELSTNQSIKAITPVVTSVFSLLIEKQPFHAREVSCLAALSCGVACVVWDGAVKNGIMGVTLCLLSTVCNACTMSLRGRLSRKTTAAELNCITAPLAALFLVPFVLILELDELSTASRSTDSFSVYLLVLGVSSALAGAYNVVHTLMIQKESAVATAALGQVKIVCLVLLSFRYLEGADDLSVREIVGCLATFFSFSLYVHSKL